MSYNVELAAHGSLYIGTVDIRQQSTYNSPFSFLQFAGFLSKYFLHLHHLGDMSILLHSTGNQSYFLFMQFIQFIFKQCLHSSHLCLKSGQLNTTIKKLEQKESGEGGVSNRKLWYRNHSSFSSFLATIRWVYTHFVDDQASCGSCQQRRVWIQYDEELNTIAHYYREDVNTEELSMQLRLMCTPIFKLLQNSHNAAWISNC